MTWREPPETGRLWVRCWRCDVVVTYDDVKQGGAAAEVATPDGVGALCADCADADLELSREPRDGESRDKNGHIRPVPPGVDNRPEE